MIGPAQTVEENFDMGIAGETLCDLAVELEHRLKHLHAAPELLVNDVGEVALEPADIHHEGIGSQRKIVVVAFFKVFHGEYSSSVTAMRLQ